jgi:hypothetical protein
LDGESGSFDDEEMRWMTEVGRFICLAGFIDWSGRVRGRGFRGVDR